MRHIKIAAVALAGVMLLAGCSKGGDSSKSESGNINSANFGDEIVVKVGDREVTKSEFNFYLTTYKQNFDIEQARKYAVDYCTNHNLLIAVGEAMGIEFDSDTKKEIKNTKAQMMSTYENNGGYNKFLKDNDLTDEYMDTLVEVGYYSEALKEKMGEKEYTDEEKRDFFKKNYRRAKHILISTRDASTNEELSEEEQAKAKTKAEELLARAQGGEDFDALVSEFSEDPGSQANPEGYVFTDDEMVKEFQDGVDSIKPGEFILVQTSYGYHVIQRLELDENPEFFEEQYESVKENLSDVMKSKMFEEQVRAWADEYGIVTTVNDEIINAME